MKKKVVIVDDNDVPVGTKYRDEVDYLKETYRCTGIWLVNSQGEILIAQRKFTKSKDPGKWGPAAAGTVEEGETYESNAYKELEEEIGVTGIKLELGPKQHSVSPRKYFGQWFLCEIDRSIEQFVIQEDEVEQIKWINKDDLLLDMKNYPDKYVTSLHSIINLLIK